MKVIHEAERDWIPLTDGKKIEYLIGQKLAGTPFFLKNTDPPAEVRPAGKKGGAILFHCNPSIEIGESVTLYTTINRQIELDFRVINYTNQGEIEMKPVAARIGQTYRRTPRIMVGEEVYARNFQIVKEDEITVDRSRIAYEIIFREFYEKVSRLFPRARLFGDADGDRPEESRIVERMGLTLCIVDTKKLEAYRSCGKGYLDYYSILTSGLRVQTALDSYKERGIESYACIPVTYRFPNGKTRVLATLVLEGKAENQVTIETIEKMQGVLLGLAERLINVNAFHVDSKQSLLNVSENGAAIICRDELLLKYLPGIRNVTFDLVFKKQSPIRVQAGVRYIRQRHGAMVVGLQFDGAAQGGVVRNGLERLKSLVQTLSKANE